MSYKFIDVSVFQGVIDWEKVKASGISHAIIRVGGRYYTAGSIYKDSQAERNLKNATAAGIKIGVYFYSQAITEKEAVQEANFTISMIQNHKIELPVIIDTEINFPKVERLARITPAERTRCTIAFMKRIKLAGYVPMFYCGSYYLKDRLVESELANYDMWLAQYTNKPFCSRKYQFWQYTSKGKVPGINGAVDMNIAYKEYYPSNSAGVLEPEKPKDEALVVDGYLGTKSIVKLQRWLGTVEDGIISGQLQEYKRYYPALYAVKFGTGGSLCIKELQEKLKTKIDGIVGPKTIKALQTYLNENGAALKVDGYLGEKSAKALQEYLNKIA